MTHSGACDCCVSQSMLLSCSCQSSGHFHKQRYLYKQATYSCLLCVLFVPIQGINNLPPSCQWHHAKCWCCHLLGPILCWLHNSHTGHHSKSPFHWIWLCTLHGTNCSSVRLEKAKEQKLQQKLSGLCLWIVAIHLLDAKGEQLICTGTMLHKMSRPG